MFSPAAFISFGLLLAPFASAAVHDVTVGAGGLTYSPEAISAVPGDQVVFHFQPKNHTVTQSSFASPCGKKDGGMDSGFMPVAANVTDNFPTYTVTVNDTEPIWIYCAQAANTPSSHCGAGMVFAINCGADGSPNSFTNFKNAALAVGASLASAAPSGSAAPGYGYPSASGTAPQATGTGTTTGSATTTTHTVVVGGPGKLAFNPPSIQAQPNEVVLFQFQQKNHTVTQSSFGAPCEPLAATSTTGQNGFDSGFFPVADNTTTYPTWSITVNDTNPVWAYCKQKTATGSHCGAGMVFAINAVDSSAKNFSAFQAAAMKINGTSANSTSGGASSSDAVPSLHISTAVSVGLAAVGAAFTLLL
ncbi:hypothetical protein BD410DRAFT_780896 [Rickenella mellea]|uniref:Cupredoxin n=1 Tax=Rickenella mellea TaxID=50990 RepID=A0A4Y7QM07_9AGAM|nr:hypothetical protein BD410DRAFT_780896 [Rickenella mellea]